MELVPCRPPSSHHIRASLRLTPLSSLQYYSSDLFGAAGFGNTSVVGILIAGINAVFTIVSMFTMDRIGRRRMFLIGLPVMCGALVVSAVAFHFMTASTAGQIVSGKTDYPKKWVAIMLTGM